MEKKCGVVYKIQCGHCQEIYIGETEDLLGSDLENMSTVPKEHKPRARSFLLFNCCKGRRNLQRRIREAIEIHCQVPTLNRDVGYELPAIYRDVPTKSCDKNVQRPSYASQLNEAARFGRTYRTLYESCLSLSSSLNEGI